MANDTIRLNQASRNLNVSYSRLAEYLQKQGHDVDNSPNARITTEQYSLLEKAFASSKAVADAAKEIAIGASRTNKTVAEPAADDDAGEEELLIRDPKADSAAGKPADKPGKKEVAFAETTRVQGPKILGKIELDSKNNPVRKPKQEAPKQEAPKKETPPPAPKQDVAPVVEEPVAEAATPATPPPAPVMEEVAQAPTPPKAPAKEEAPKHKPEQPAAKEEPEAYEEAAYEEDDLPDDDDAVVASDDDDDDETPSQKPKPVAEDEDDDLIKAKATKLKGLKVVGKIELPVDRKRTKAGPGGAVSDKDKDKKRKRKRVKKAKGTPILPEAGQDKPKTTPAASTSTSSSSAAGGNKKDKRGKKRKDEASEQEVDQQVKKTLTQMNTAARGNKSNKVLYRRKKRLAAEELREQEMRQAEQDAYLLRVAEFISTSDLATLMEVDVNEIIMKSMNLGMFISINQRLDAEAITVLADEFGYEVEFTSAEEEVDVVLEEEDAEEDLETRAPIVTIMGHVDHGKTSLLDFIRKSKVAEGEAGGITQHIGAYDVTAANGRRIVFLDTPGHEAFTAMRARGAKVTDVVIIVIAADDSVMPQTVEAINHAQLAGVPYVIAFNKVDKPAANVNRIKEQLAQINVLVDDWGGKVQTQEISAKTGQGIDDLLELVLLESDILELKANPNKNATGTVIEASLDKGRGYVATVLVQGGSLAIGDVILAGSHYGKVKAMNDHRGKRLMKVGPSTPVQVLGLNGAPQAGDKFNALESEREAKEIATKRGQIMREQSIRATKRTTLSDLGRRIALGNFHQLNIIIKGDVDGSIEALSDSLQKLSTEEIEVNILQKAVGPITEGDVLLATASDAIVIGFQVRPVPSARKLAENEEVEVRLYSVIYDAINDVKAAMEGLLSPEIEEIITGNAEVREVFRISRIGTVAGCMITDGTVKRNSKLRVVRDGIVVFGGEHGGEVQALKRYKDDVSEVRQGFECGLSIRGYNDLQVGDVVEAYEERETKRKL